MKEPGRLLHFIKEASTAAAERSDTKIGLSIRAALASLPWIGSAASVLVEAHLTQSRSIRVDRFLERFDELERKMQELSASDGASSSISDALLEHAAAATAQTPDPDRAAIFANIVWFSPDADPAEVFRHFLIEVAAALSRYELALLLHLSSAQDASERSDFARVLFEIHAKAAAHSEVRDFALNRLQTYRLISALGSDYEVTAIGRHLISVL